MSDLEHGRPGRYQAGCRCGVCRGNYARRQKAYRLRARVTTSKGTPAVPQLVPSAPVREHLARLIASGWRQVDIVSETGVSQGAVSDLVRGRGGRQRVARRIADAILALEPLPALDDYVDPVVVDRLITGAHWQTIGATRAERIAAAERLAWHWTPIRARQKADGTAEQNLDGESLTSIERRFSLRAGRDFRKAPDAVAQRGAA